MSQILLGKPKDWVLYSELHFPKPTVHLKSQASEVACNVCGSILKEGNGLVARRINGNIVFLCSHHL
ncbi:MAG: hypothetical protein QXE84_07725 [Candidatus Nitrosotenuis sp.]|uniref:Uncharacterized protein n=1 Tax=Candidatus Nitrosotenuis uzonensis TaxID=1407055 RepID=A0A812EY60_9ARCH|nr:hypothetical protein [Candidatus Nitrosotenuis uzonensis]MCA2003381.1 hypothetical protein [Candidatus Nitrosotenuis sp.]CAE6498958.1 conserved hypothetical protein [Candidatus Nitrosotenuis uzonensis]